MRYLVTGSTGQLGTPTTAALRAAGLDVRGVTRTGGGDGFAADLVSGHGLESAVTGIDTVIHLATTNGKKDLLIARNLAAAAGRAQVSHLVLISIVGAADIPLGFYQDRAKVEQIFVDSAIPVTIQRATQFHSFVDTLFSAQRCSPVVVVPAFRFQPIAVTEVADRLAKLAVGRPLGRVPDIGGPAAATAAHWHHAWKVATRSRRPTLPLRLPGKLFAAYDAGAALVDGAPFGHVTFESYLAHKYI